MQWKEDSVIPFDGNGLFEYTATSVAPDAVGGSVISSADHDTFSADIATALSLCLTEDGQNVPTANLPMSAKKHTGCAVATATTDYMTYGQAGQLRTKIVEIGDWDMSSATGSLSTSVAHGLTLSKIRTISVMIRNDADTVYSSFNSASESAGTGYFYANASPVNIGINTATGGTYDHTDFDSTSYNRGWITIQYTD